MLASSRVEIWPQCSAKAIFHVPHGDYAERPRQLSLARTIDPRRLEAAPPDAKTNSLFLISAGTIRVAHRARYCRPRRHRGCPSARGGTRYRRTVGHGPRKRGQGNARRLAGELPDAARRQGREMRAGAERHRRGPAECRAHRAVLQSRSARTRSCCASSSRSACCFRPDFGLKIDKQDVGNAPFLKCSTKGCIAEVVLQDEVIKKMKGGGTAMFIIFDTPEAGIGIPISLQGFGDACRISRIQAKKGSTVGVSAADTSVGGRTHASPVQGCRRDDD